MKYILILISSLLIIPIFIVCYNILFFHYNMPDNAIDMAGIMAIVGMFILFFGSFFNDFF